MRSPIKWYGGKGLKAAKIAKYVPEGGQPYCEPYAGGAWLLFYRRPADSEVLNDLNQDLINFYRVMQDPDKARRLTHAIEWTLYSRAEFARALAILNDPEERDALKRAWALLVTCRQSFSGYLDEKRTVGNWGRQISSGRRLGWRAVSALLEDAHIRLKEVQIECRDALEVIRYWDSEEAVFYVDPPYHPETCIDQRTYKHVADDAHHRQLVETLLNVKGCATMSCYFHPVYQPLIDAGWLRVDFQTHCSAAVRTRNSGLQGDGNLKRKVPRLETILINPRAQLRLSPILLENRAA